MPTHADEETPLLAPQPALKKTPLPWFQFSILMFLQLADPLTSQVIYPFAPQLIRDIGITHGNESKVGYYVGVMQSLFFLTQVMTVLYWSRTSDRVGRKPVILLGLFGSSISMFCFGLSRTFWGLVVSRALNGALNGNIGVINSVMAEMTDATNIAQAYAYMPISWSTGGTLGPIIGGSLSRPAERFPTIFGTNEFLKKYPYFLPCAIPATFSMIALLVTFFFLQETVKTRTALSGLFKSQNGNCVSACKSTTHSEETSVLITQSPNSEKPLALRALLTPRVMIVVGNYAFLSLVDVAFRTTQPLFFSTPVHIGGLGMPPSTIGNILSMYGVFSGAFQVFFFARIHDYWGSKKTFMVGMASAIPAYLSFPVLTYLAQKEGLSHVVWAVIAFQTLISIGLSISYGAIFIFIAAVSPNRASFGATNGLSQMTVNVMRAIGPAMASSLFSLTIEKGYLGGGLVYYVLFAVVCVSMVVASMLPRKQ